jgi:hypothetical protein
MLLASDDKIHKSAFALGAFHDATLQRSTESFDWALF